jgi:hypothetical protein
MAALLDRVVAGDIPDPTGGATHFANVKTVQQRGDPAGRRGGWIENMLRNGTARQIGAHTFGNPDSQPGARSFATAAPRQQLAQLDRRHLAALAGDDEDEDLPQFRNDGGTDDVPQYRRTPGSVGVDSSIRQRVRAKIQELLADLFAD